MKTRFLRSAALIVAMILVAASCGSTSTDTDAAGSTPVEADDSTPADAVGAEGPVVVNLVDVGSGESTTLGQATNSYEKPVLAFFWAPYCPSCRSEAPHLDELAATHGDDVQIVGIGTQNDLEYAEEFLDSTGVENFPLLWEETGQSWQEFGVIAQPYLILLNDGREVKRWPGGATPDPGDTGHR